MRISHVLAAPAAALVIGLAASSAQAAPANPGSGLKAEAPSAVEQARCWWHRGHRHCSGVRLYIGPRWGYRHYGWGHRRHRWHRW